MKPAPTMPTRMGLPDCSRAFNALSTRIIASSLHVRGFGLAQAHPALELGLDRCEQGPARVLRRHFADRERPGQPEPRIVVHQAAFDPGRVELADLVARFGAVL